MHVGVFKDKSHQRVTYQIENLHTKNIVPLNTTVIIPASNEEVSIGSIVLRAKRYSQRVIVVDDVSSDRTVNIAEMAGAEVIRNYVKGEREIFLKKEIINASDSDIIVIMNPRVCHDPCLIPSIIAPIRNKNFDISVGICFYQTKNISENVLLLNNRDVESKSIGFLAFSKECFSKIDFSDFSFFSMSSFINNAEKSGIKVLHFDFREEHEASLLTAYKIGVVVPAYNEELLIKETIDGIPAYVDKIYVINDGSTDRTAEVINSITDSRVISIHHEVNKGVGAAIVNGYKHALADEMDLVAVMAGDNQMDPNQLPRLIMPIIEGKADYTKGNRLLSREMRQRMPQWRAFGNGLLSLITKIGSGYWNINDPQNGYTVISRHALETISIESLYTYYGYCNDILLKMNAFGLRVMDVAIPARYGSEKSKIRYGKYICKVAPMIFKGFLWRLKLKYVVFDFHPLVLFYFASMIFVPIGFLFGLWIAFQTMLLQWVVSGNYLLLDLFIFLIGMQLLFFAMVLDTQVNKARI